MTTESPIEQRLLGGLAIACADRNLRMSAQTGTSWPVLHPDEDEVIIFTQVPLDGFRIDMVVSGKNHVAIECDGHDFHERTKEQAEYDRSRERRIARTMGILRFTGRELFRDPIKAANEILDFISSSPSPVEPELRQFECIDLGLRNETILLCPRCRSDNLHQGTTEVWNRGEDATSGLHAVISGHDVQSNSDMTLNPSLRRQGLAIFFNCEHCGDGLRLAVVQHKGTTYLSFEDVR